LSAALLLLAVHLFRSCLWAEEAKNLAPSFSPDSIVNSANGSPASLTPNVLATLTGANLAFSTASVSLDDIGAGALPTRLGGVSVIVDGIFASLLSVSPTQVNFLIPSSVLAGETDIALVRDGTATQTTQITLLDAAPALFLVDTGIAATHGDGSLISPDSPAQPGEEIVIYGAGFGRTSPRQIDGAIPRMPAQITLLDQLQVLLDGQAVPAENVLYAGITPGHPGLYQINLRLPPDIGASPEVRVAIGDQMSQSSLHLQVAVVAP
jgi:uncharacterized protein (TIGR03437 family)